MAGLGVAEADQAGVFARLLSLVEVEEGLEDLLVRVLNLLVEPDAVTGDGLGSCEVARDRIGIPQWRSAADVGVALLSGTHRVLVGDLQHQIT